MDLLTEINASPSEINALLGEAGLPPLRHVVGLRGGANNRVYRVDCERESVLLKAYFFHPDDPRDRLGAEFEFLRFAWNRGLRCLPRPLACDRSRRLGLYEFIEGRVLAASEVSRSHIEQALDFYRALNRHRDDPAARSLPRASESCFTLAEHLACVERRVTQLEKIEIGSPEDEQAAELIHDQLMPAWRRIRDRALRQAAENAIALDCPIDRRDARLSPSDFGFHNAIAVPDGQLRFIDFEYAGWDDAAKMVCDFLCQPAVPVPGQWADEFARAAVADLSDPEMHLRRVRLLGDVYRIKWCCIMLNDFAQAGRRRRRFAQETQTEETRKHLQLQKVGLALRALSE